MYFDPEKDPWNSTAEYKKVSSVQVSLKKLHKDNKKQLKDLEKERKVILKSIDEVKSKSAMSYMESAILANELSSKDIETHALLQDQGMRWLYNQGYVCTTEIGYSQYRFDVIGYDKDDTVTIIGAKASREDFQGDTKWQNYLKYCNKFYFIFHEHELATIKRYIIEEVTKVGAGILIVRDSKRVEVFSECNLMDECQDKEDIKFNIARACSKKIIFGY